MIKKTKIVATVADYNCTPTFIRSLYSAGMNVVRLNTAHVEPENMVRMVDVIRSVSDKIGIMVDTKGPNIRTCNLDAPLELKAGDKITISGSAIASEDTLQVTYPRFANDVSVGQKIVFDDGDMELEILEKTNISVVCIAKYDGVIKNRKSVNVPGASMKMPALTEKDRIFIDLAIKLEIDFIAHSFVRNRDDVMAVKSILDTGNSPIQIIAKIENREGVDNLISILDVADGIMVARGDLGIEIPFEEVPLIQKHIIHESMSRGKVVITATQMLQSMENSMRPTRAEVSDVANAVFDGTDAVMLSGETAHGKYPVEAVEVMAKVAAESEKSPEKFFIRIENMKTVMDPNSYIIKAAVKSADFLPIKAIICNTASGKSARYCAAFRPNIPVFSLSHNSHVVRQMSLYYGIYTEHNICLDNPIELSRVSAEILLERNLVKESDLVVIISKNTSHVEGNNLCCIATIKELLG